MECWAQAVLLRSRRNAVPRCQVPRPNPTTAAKSTVRIAIGMSQAAPRQPLEVRRPAGGGSAAAGSVHEDPPPGTSALLPGLQKLWSATMVWAAWGHINIIIVVGGSAQMPASLLPAMSVAAPPAEASRTGTRLHGQLSFHLCFR